MTPLMNSAAPWVVNSSSRQSRRLSAVEGTSMASKRFLMVPLLSSAARMPLPGATNAAAVTASSSTVIVGTSSQVMGGMSVLWGMASPFLQDEPVPAAALGLLDQPVAGRPRPDRQVPD